MMIDKILNVLKTYKNIDYKITEVKKTRLENYFVKKEREMDRFVDTKHIYLGIYKVFEEDGEKYRGSASAEIHPTMSDSEISKCIDDAIFGAGFVKNKFYPLVSEKQEPFGEIKSELENVDFKTILNRLEKAFYSNDNKTNGFLNYSEFFISKLDYRIINSKGVDVSFTKYRIFIETSATWNENNKEVEFCEAFTFSGCDEKFISESVERLLDSAKLKTTASNMPKISDADILLKGECLKNFFSYFYANSSAANVYTGQSTFKIGESLQSGGDKISMSLNPFLKGSTASSLYDDDGFALKNQEIIKDGVLQKYWGDVRFSHYLNVEPMGNISNFEISGGTYSVDELRQGKYLELISFSDFHMDSVTGDFGSEIRLGFYCDGQSKIAVTGGSISGNIKNVLDALKMSKETAQFNNFVGPEMISVRNVSIAF